MLQQVLMIVKRPSGISNVPARRATIRDNIELELRPTENQLVAVAFLNNHISAIFVKLATKQLVRYTISKGSRASLIINKDISFIDTFEAIAKKKFPK